MSSIDYLPIPPPPPKASAVPPKLTVDQEGKYTKVYEHFTGAGYSLPGEEKSEFTEEEEFWLVRFIAKFSFCGGADSFLRATSAC